MSRILEIFTDGACQGNPGEAAIGVVILENGKIIKKISQAIGPATNNIAEYTALIYALQEALILKADQVIIKTDSELMFKQVHGDYKIKHQHLQVLYDQVQHLKSGIKKVEIIHIPREQNKDADKLATKAIKKEQAKVITPKLNTLGEESPSS